MGTYRERRGPADGRGGGGAHSNGISRPEVNQRGAQPAVFDQKLVALTCRVGPRSRAMKDHGPILELGDPDPERDAERIDARELPNAGKVYVVLAVELDGLAANAVDQLRIVERLARLGPLGAIHRLILRE